MGAKRQGRQSWMLGSRPTDFWLGVVGVVVDGLYGKPYSVFCTESMLENVYF